MKDNQMNKKWAEVIAKAWADESFKKELLSNPTKVLKENGLDLHEMDCKIVENSDNTFYLVLPKKPEGDISLENLSAGKIICTCFSM